MEMDNTVTALGGDAVHGEVVAAAPEHGEGREISGQKELEPAGPFQSPAANKSFARLRRERDRLARELENAKKSSVQAEKEEGVTGQAAEGVEKGEPFEKGNEKEPFSEEGEGSDVEVKDTEADAADQAEQLADQLPEGEEAGSFSYELTALLQERAVMQELLFASQFERDLQQLKGLFPLEKVAHISELGEEFMALRAAGVDNVTAYVAVQLAKNVGKPPEAGAVSSSNSEEEGFFTSRELDHLTEKELSDPKILQKAIKSMTKWK
jgi:hypothetical protein